MKKKVIWMAVCTLLIVTLLSVLFGKLTDIMDTNSVKEENKVPESYSQSTSESSRGIEENISMKQVPESYSKPTSESSRGLVESIDYQTTYNREIYNKEAQVYLPASYDEKDDRQYNIVYLMHGSTMTSRDFIGDNGRDNGNETKNMIDNMIEKGDIIPTIFVVPTYYPNRDFVSGSYYDDDILNRAFAENEIIDLMEVVEGRYNTYAQSTSFEDLEASRDHRAFAGFSMGAITTWYVFENQLKYFSTFIPMAGDSWTIEENGGAVASEKTAQKLAEVVSNSSYSPEDFKIFASVGGNDGTSGSMKPQIAAMLKIPVFSEDNLSYEEDAGGRHDLISINNQLYSQLPYAF